ncbi:DUF2306 domain-containing protein [Pseudophaeobacter sp.]|uniref:DUF2306 domain-containing protein n=1 Tax=Pseudophaeobacter sp. TaxID=1971739 RepID=UPI00329A4B50
MRDAGGYDSALFWQLHRGLCQPDIYLDRIVALRLHISGGIAAALTGPPQFWGGMRIRFRALHRALRKIYIAAVLTGAVFGLIVATTAVGGTVSQAGFSALALAWTGTTLMAYRHISLGAGAVHRRWMIRSFALTFAFVMLRIIFPALQFGAGLDQVIAFQITSWACWVPNLLVLELAMRRRDRANGNGFDGTTH